MCRDLSVFGQWTQGSFRTKRESPLGLWSHDRKKGSLGWYKGEHPDASHPVLHPDSCFYGGAPPIHLLQPSKQPEQQAQTTPKVRFGRFQVFFKPPSLGCSRSARQMRSYGWASLKWPEATLRLPHVACVITPLDLNESSSSCPLCKYCSYIFTIYFLCIVLRIFKPEEIHNPLVGWNQIPLGEDPGGRTPPIIYYSQCTALRRDWEATTAPHPWGYKLCC